VAASGQVVFEDGESSKTVAVTVNGDNTVEPHETFRLLLFTTANYVPLAGEATILTDDVTISINDATTTEGGKSASKFVPGNFNTLVFGPDNELYVVGGGLGYNPWEIARYDSATGALIGTFASGSTANQFRDLIFHTDGYLYVASISTDEVLRFNGTSGEFVDVFVKANNNGGIDAPDGLAFGPDANSDGIPELYVTGWLSHSVVRYDGASGQPLGTYIPPSSGGLTSPFDIEFNGGFAYVTSAGTHQILKYNATSGAFVDVAASGGIDYPRDVAFGPDGLMYVSSGNNDRILRFTVSGVYVDDYVPASAAGMDNPRAIAFAPNGDLFVAAHGSDRNIYRLSSGPEVAFTLSLNSASALPVTVNYDTAAGSADAGDFNAASGTITFAPGQTSRTIFIQTVNDAKIELTETFTVVLSNPTGGGVIADGTGVGTIIDDDTKFYVVDDAAANRTFEYGTGGPPSTNAGEDYALASANSTPRGAASTAAGDKVWVVDANKNVYVYGPGGNLLGSWAAGSLVGNPVVQGIATDGTDIWIVDAKQDKVYKYTGAATRLSGSQSASTSFSLNSGNKDASDLVTDGTSLWVLNNTTTDKVFIYSLTGALQGSWTINGGGGRPTGITLDPSSATSPLWIVDSATDRVYQFARPTGSSGTVTASLTFVLAAANTNPQGIADPPVTEGETVEPTADHTAAVDQAMLDWDAPAAAPGEDAVEEQDFVVNPNLLISEARLASLAIHDLDTQSSIEFSDPRRPIARARAAAVEILLSEWEVLTTLNQPEKPRRRGI
jgi:glucose/arabinose dehydrogenase